MSQKPVFGGDLSVITLPQIFQIIGGNNSTGVLRMKSEYARAPGLVYFTDGNPINAVNGSLQGIDAIYALFGWTVGEFDFLQEKVEMERLVQSSPMSIMLDAMRMLDDGMIQRVGPMSIGKEWDPKSGKPKDGGSRPMAVIKGPLVDYRYVMDEEVFRDSEKIVAEGGYGTWFWVILDGVVKITRETSRGPIALLKLGEGCFIGSLTSFSFTGHVRDTTATAEGKVELGVLDNARLGKEHAFLTADFRELLLSLDGRLRKITDRTIDLFTGEGYADELTGAEEIVMKQGSTPKEVFSVIKGEAYVIRKTDKGHRPLMTLEKGDVFGDIPFLNMGHEPRSASILGSKDLEVDKLNTEALQDAYYGLSRTFRGLVDNVATCVFLTTRQACRLQDGKDGK
jgi:CRP-like cAMP-binding protein